MDKEFIAMRKKGLVYDYGLQKWVKEPVGMYSDPALAQLFRPTPRAVDRFQRGQAVANPLQMSLFAEESPSTSSGN
jgi:hypothetical protein